MLQVSYTLVNRVYMNCLYVVLIQGGVVAKAFKAFRFDPALYARFKKLVGESGLTVTEALERFMGTCVSAGAITFPTASKGGVEAEARVLLAWLKKGKRFWYGPGGEEDQSVESRLLALLGQVEDEELRREIEEDLKKLSEPTQ